MSLHENIDRYKEKIHLKYVVVNLLEENNDHNDNMQMLINQLRL